MANGCSVTTAIRNTIVRPASRMFSAISFGVFCRSAPSTNAIIRSRKGGPCAAVIFTLIQSEMTCVPPVTTIRIEQLGDGLGLGLAQGCGLGLTAPFRHRFGEIGKHHREPEPEI